MQKQNVLHVKGKTALIKSLGSNSGQYPDLHFFPFYLGISKRTTTLLHIRPESLDL